MGCNCMKKAGGQNYLFTPPSGSPRTYSTEVEARAAQIRAGGGTITTVAR